MVEQVQCNHTVMGLRPIKPHLLRLASDQLPEGLNGSHGLEYDCYNKAGEHTVQRAVTCFCKSDFRYTSSVTSMIRTPRPMTKISAYRQ